MDHDSIIGLFAVFFIFGLPVMGWIAIRAFRFIERMEMIKRGIVPPPDPGFGWGRRRAWREWAQQQQQQMRWGPGNAPQGPPPGWNAGGYWEYDDPQRVLFKGIRLAAVGFALFIGLSFIGGMPGTPGFTYGPWVLGGLIPLFIGIAQIIVALLSGAQLPGAGPRATFVRPPNPPPPPPPPSGAPPPAWEQPGRRFEELSKPAPPPDAR